MSTIIEVSMEFGVLIPQSPNVVRGASASLGVSSSTREKSTSISSVDITDSDFGGSAASLGRRQVCGINNSVEFDTPMGVLVDDAETAIAVLMVGSHEGLKLDVEGAYDRPNSVFFWG